MKYITDAHFSDSFVTSFNFIWEKIIYPTIQAAGKEIDEDFKKASHCDLAYANIEKYKLALMDFYHEKRQWLKSVYLPHEEHPLLDVHKLGAILCRSMLAYKPFYFDFDAATQYVLHKYANENDEQNHIEWFVDNIYVNYKVAFYASVGMIYLELLYSYKGDDNVPINPGAFEYFISRKVLDFYDKSERHDSFENSCIIALQKNDVLGRSFDYLTYAIMLFQLEQYNRMKYSTVQMIDRHKEEIESLSMKMQF